ncbi:SpoIIE family protein phosphatase [candidate division KSB1 bacterium]|nr:SpoIIE family protein phosphatase [candidate division KSB1 bacterium]
MNKAKDSDRQNSNLAALKTIAETLNQALDLNQALHDSLEIILKILGLNAGWVFLTNRDNTTFTLAANHGLPPALKHPGRVWKGGCRCNRLACEDKLTEAVNIVYCSRIEHSKGDRQNLVDHASIPLETPRAQIGILNVATAAGRLFSDEELQLLTTVGNQMGVAVERARIFEQTRDQRIQEQAALLTLSNALLNTQNLEAILGQVVKVTAEIFAADVCALMLHEANGGTRKLASTGLKPKQEVFLEKPWNESGAGQTFLQLGRSGQISLQERGEPSLRLFPLEEPIPPEASTSIIEDRAMWQFWSEVGCRSIYLAPIQSISQNHPIGLLLVAHKTPRKVAEAEVHLTNLLANQASLAIEQTELHEIRLAQEALEKELSMAQEIQHSFLPEATPKIPGWEIATYYQSAKHVGGDFYDFIPLKNANLGIVIADVADKGVPAALVMALSRTLVRGIAIQDNSPAQVLCRANEMLMTESRNRRFITLFYAVLNPKTGALTCARAGHHPPYVWQASESEFRALQPAGMALGIVAKISLEEETLTIQKNDIFVLYTDGVTEAMNSKQEEFSEERLMTLIKQHHRLSAEKLVKKIQKEVENFRAGSEPSDDFTLLVIKRLK